MIITGKKYSKSKFSRAINGDDEISREQLTGNSEFLLRKQAEKNGTDDFAAETPQKIRLDHLLVQKYPEYNRSTLQSFIKSGYVTVAGKKVIKSNSLVLPDSEIALSLPTEKTDKPNIPVIFEDDNVLVLNKPSGMLSMAKGEYCAEPTLEDYGLLVHRLDRDTSGVVILAKNPATQKMLRKQFQDRKTHKTYMAIVEGAPKMPEAMIDLPIARNLKHPTTFMVSENGKASQTAYKTIRSNDQYTLLELKPRTGRTHQLRVHLNYLNLPIVGDPVYGSGKKITVASPRADINYDRLYLHASSLEITIPGEQENIRKIFEAPLPPEFQDLLPEE